MELRHLHAFLAVADELHVGRAAKRLHVSQPALSMTLRSLEEEVGARLFIRRGRGIVLSDAGDAFRPDAARAVRAAADAIERARQRERGDEGHLRVRFALMCMLTVVPDVLAALSREHPGITIELAPATSRGVIESIRKGECDVGLVTWAADCPDLEQTTILKEPLAVFTRCDHDLTRRKTVSLSDLGPLPIITLSRQDEPEIWSRLKAACRQHGFDPNIVMEVRDMETLFGATRANIGISMAPQSLRLFAPKGCRSLPEHDGVTASIG